jgi:hypothetical protein
MKPAAEDRSGFPALAPWEAEPYRLWSLWEMIQTYGDSWWKSAAILGQIVDRLNKSNGAAIGIGNAKKVAIAMGLAQNNAAPLGMRSVITQCDRIMKHLEESGNIQGAEFRRLLLGLMERAEDELKGQRFFALGLDDIPLYEQPEPLFGAEVHEAFPSAQFDISESGKCFALNRWTASVGHLMRALDPVVHLLQDTVGVADPKNDWAAILNQIHVSLKKWPDTPDRQWYGEAAVVFWAIKDAYRNYAQHGKEKYDEERARQIYDHSRAFLRHMATRLKEAP